MYLLSANDFDFPPVKSADSEGLVAIGGDLSPGRLYLAYTNGIFPWFWQDGYYFWYSPNPRMVLFPQNLKISKSMRSCLNQQKFTVTHNQCFQTVMKQCSSTNRKAQEGTWLTPDFIDAYTTMHRIGLAHSVEVWQSGTLVGGLYGIRIGKVFFGESMFATVSNASKFGFIKCVQDLQTNHDCQLIDCQQATSHLASLGANTIDRTEFVALLKKWTK